MVLLAEARVVTEQDLYVYRAHLVRVIDGDTVVVDLDLGCDVWLRQQHCRLTGINAPEKIKPTREQGLAAKEHLEQLLGGHERFVVTTNYDRRCTFSRLLVTIWVEGVNVNQRMVADRFAEPMP